MASALQCIVIAYAGIALHLLVASHSEVRNGTSISSLVAMTLTVIDCHRNGRARMCTEWWIWRMAIDLGTVDSLGRAYLIL